MTGRVRHAVTAAGAVLLCLVLFGPALPAGASAQGPAARAERAEVVAQARALFEQGLRLAEERRPDDAAEAFRASLERHPRPSTALNLAIVLDRTGRGTEALRALDAFADLEAEATVADREDAAELRARVRARLATLRLRLTPSDARVELDGRPLPGSGGERLLVLDPGRHRLLVAAPAHEPSRLELSVAGGEERVERVELSPAEVALTQAAASTAEVDLTVHDEPEEPSDGLPWALWVGGGAAIAVLAVVAAILIASSGADDDTPVLEPYR